MGLNEECIHICFRKENFRVSFLEPFVIVFVAAMIVCEAFFVLMGNSSPQVLFVFVPVTVSSLCTIAILFLQSRYKFGLGPDGIECYDFWCRPSNAGWDEVQDIRLVRTAGLEYLQIFMNDRSQAIWIPLFVKRYSTLQQLMMTYTHHSFVLHDKLTKIWK